MVNHWPCELASGIGSRMAYGMQVVVLLDMLPYQPYANLYQPIQQTAAGTGASVAADKVGITKMLADLTSGH